MNHECISIPRINLGFGIFRELFRSLFYKDEFLKIVESSLYNKINISIKQQLESTIAN